MSGCRITEESPCPRTFGSASKAWRRRAISSASLLIRQQGRQRALDGGAGHGELVAVLGQGRGVGQGEFARRGRVNFGDGPAFEVVFHFGGAAGHGRHAAQGHAGLADDRAGIAAVYGQGRSHAD